jgi:hypothetical protein
VLRTSSLLRRRANLAASDHIAVDLTDERKQMTLAAGNGRVPDTSCKSRPPGNPQLGENQNTENRETALSSPNRLALAALFLEE